MSQRRSDAILGNAISEEGVNALVKMLDTNSSLAGIWMGGSPLAVAKQKTLVRILLLGHGGAGKTSLLKAMSNLAASATEAATIGMVEQALERMDEAGEIEFVAWDFAGQLEYMNTHQMFLASSQAIYLVAIDVSRPYEWQQKQLREWLHLLEKGLANVQKQEKAEERTVRVLVVGTKVDILGKSFDPRLAPGPLSSVLSDWAQQFEWVLGPPRRGGSTSRRR